MCRKRKKFFLDNYIKKKLPKTFIIESPLPLFLLFFRRYDHQDRLTAQEAMAHPYFDPVRSLTVEEVKQISEGGSSTSTGFV